MPDIFVHSSRRGQNPAIKTSTHTGITEMTQQRRANVMQIPKAASKDIAAGRAKKPPVMLKVHIYNTYIHTNTERESISATRLTCIANLSRQFHLKYT